MRAYMDVEVECGPGPRGEPEPIRLRLGATVVDGLEVLDRWPALGHRHVKLRARDGRVFILRHDAATQSWQLVFYQEPNPAAGCRHPEGQA